MKALEKLDLVNICLCVLQSGENSFSLCSNAIGGVNVAESKKSI